MNEYLTDEQWQLIWEDWNKGLTIPILVALHGVSHQTIYNVLHKKMDEQKKEEKK